MVCHGRGGAAVGECWAAAVAVAAEDPPADLRVAVAEELVALWSDLGEALRRACVPGCPRHDGGDQLKKCVLGRGSRTPSTSMSIFSL